MIVEVKGLKVRYSSRGEGIPILLLHGWGGSMESMEELQGELALRGFRAIDLDLPGFGESEKPSGAWSVSDYVDFVLAFARELSIERFYVFGHSFGGRIAIKLAAEKGEILEGLILCDSAGIKPRAQFKIKVFRTVAKVGKAIFSLPLLNLLKEPATRALYFLAGTRDYYKAGEMRATMRKIVEEDLQPLLKKIKVPALIIWGEVDRETPIEDAETMQREIGNSKLEVVKGVGHGVPLRKPKEVAGMIEVWIEELKS